MNYYSNKKLSRTRTTTPSLTDQAGARETDINIIVGRMMKTGQLPGAPLPPIYGDFTVFPTDLRSMIETARTLRDHHDKLPKPLRDLTPEQLLGLTAEQLHAIMKPPTSQPTTEPTT